MRFYLRFLSVCYFVGAALHVADLFGKRLEFSSMAMGWQIWIVYLLIFDVIAGIGLWRLKGWGIAAFILIAISQLIAYLRFAGYFGEQTFLIIFHVATLSIYSLLELTKWRRLISC